MIVQFSFQLLIGFSYIQFQLRNSRRVTVALQIASGPCGPFKSFTIRKSECYIEGEIDLVLAEGRTAY